MQINHTGDCLCCVTRPFPSNNEAPRVICAVYGSAEYTNPLVSPDLMNQQCIVDDAGNQPLLSQNSFIFGWSKYGCISTAMNPRYKIMQSTS